jgi:hypothetical protein
VVDQDPSHQPSGDAQEVRTILPPDVTGVGKPEKRLVDERGRLEGVVFPLAPHARAGEPAQLGFDEGHQLIECRLVAVAPGAQQLGHVVWGGRHQVSSARNAPQFL